MPDIEEYRRLESRLRDAQAKIREQQEFISKVSSPPFAIGTVLHDLGDTLLISASSGGMTEVNKPRISKPCFAGSLVRINMESGQVVDVLPPVPSVGDVRTVASVLDDKVCEVDSDGTKHIVAIGNIRKLEVGDRVVLDSTESVIVTRLPRTEAMYAFQQESFVTWEEVGGLREAKRLMREAIEEPFMFPELYRLYGKEPPKGILLHGLPGNGKTLLAKAAAKAIADIHRKDKGGFFYVKGPEILSKWVGETESTIRALFTQTRRFRKDHGFAPILFIDEADAVLNKRGSRHSSDVDSTIVPMFLAEMDGMDEPGPIVVLATNRADALDEAVVREGRVDRKIRIEQPCRDTAPEVFRVHFQSVPTAETLDALCDMAADELFSDEYEMYRIIERNSNALSFKLGDIASGAMIAGIVQTSTSLAIRRHIADGETTPRKVKVKGITLSDVKEATRQVFRQNTETNHESYISHYLKVRNVEPARIERAFAATV